MKKDTVDVRIGKGLGFLTKDGKLYLKRCFDCGRENYAMAVPSGICAWCGEVGMNHAEYGKILDAWQSLNK